MMPAEKKPSVSVIIVSYQAGEVLVRCVESVLDSAVQQVIIVDNGSTDGSVQSLHTRYGDDTRIHWLSFTKNIGYSAAGNRAFSFVQSAYVLYLNPDCVVHKGAVNALSQALSTHSSAAMVGPLLLNPDGSEQAGGRRNHPTVGRVLSQVLYLWRLSATIFPAVNMNMFPIPCIPTKVEAISGACMLFRRESIEKVGGMDEKYFLHCDDLDWCMRMRTAGKEIYFVSDAQVTHIGGWCTQLQPISTEWHKHKGMVRLARKFSSPWTVILWWMGSWGYFVCRLPRLVYVAVRVKKNRLKKHGS